VAVALGVAVLGSVLAQAYRARLQPALTGLPAAVRHTATVSIAQTQAIAQHLGPGGPRLLAAADSSFVGAMHVASLISVLIAAAGAVAIGFWMPGRAAAALAGPVVPVAAAEAVGGAGVLDA
jgi:hypothetical protein